MFYHISKNDLGEEIQLTPKLPGSCDVEDEGDIPRICVSTDIYSCLKGILSLQKFNIEQILLEFRTKVEPFEELQEWMDKGGTILSPVIYTSNKKAFLPPDASDFRKNKEYWYVEKTKFKRNGYLCLETIINNQQLKIVKERIEVEGKIFLNTNLKKYVK